MPPPALHDAAQSGENTVSGDKRRGAQSPFRPPLKNSVIQPRDRQQRQQEFKTESPPSVVRTLRDENARLAHEVRVLKEELHHLRRSTPSSSPTKATTTASSSSSSLRVRERPPRSSSLQLRRRSSSGINDDENDTASLYEVLVREDRGAARVDARSWHLPAHHRPATATSLPHDVESHQSAQGLHHRRAAAAAGGAGAAAHVGPIHAGPPTATTTTTRVRPLAVMGGGAPDDDGDDDDDAVVQLAAEAAHPQAAASASFCARVQDRAGWLVGLLVLQSMSSFIISRNEALLQSHLVIVQFLTMLVGAGGNAGNQASVRGEWGVAGRTTRPQ
jgi:hypothetical protein